jgi:hypothetical protein
MGITITHRLRLFIPPPISHSHLTAMRVGGKRGIKLTKNTDSEQSATLPRAGAKGPDYPGEQENVPAKDGTTVPARAETAVQDRAPSPMQDRAQPTVQDRAPSPMQDRAQPTVQDRATAEDATVLATAPTKNELRGDDEDVLEWFARTLAKPSNAELGEMLRWTQKTVVQEGIIEHQLRWLTRARPILAKIDKLTTIVNPLKVKRTMLLLVTADYMHKPRQKVFDLPGIAGRTAYERWMRRPELASIYHELYALMEAEVLEHELSEIRKATRITRTSAGRAAEVRSALLEHPNPWVALQSARDIMQSADRQTAAKGGKTNVSLSAQLTTEQVEQLLNRASKELNSWADLASAQQDDSHRPVIIVDQQPDLQDDVPDQTAVPTTDESTDTTE